jgi:hypothetical protein
MCYKHPVCRLKRLCWYRGLLSQSTHHQPVASQKPKSIDLRTAMTFVHLLWVNRENGQRFEAQNELCSFINLL